MNKNTVLISVSVLALIIGGFYFTQDIIFPKNDSPTASPGSNTVTESSAYRSVEPADKIEVVHFHATEQCSSCIAVGKYAKQTITEKFPEEYASGKIVFKEINVDLKENQDIVTKYQARGSSLFVNAIRNEKDSIEEDTTVWRLVTLPDRYLSYFDGKLKGLLGK
jgi:actin-related protein